MERKGIIILTTALGVVLIQIIGLTFTQVVSANSVLTFQCGFGADKSYTVSMPDGVAKNGSGCEGELVLDSKVKVIDREAFANSKLTSVVIPDSVKSIGHRAFKNSLINSVVFGNSVQWIGEMAFENTKISNVIIPDSAERINNWIFRGAPILNVEYCLAYVWGLIGDGRETDWRLKSWFSVNPTCPAEKLKLANERYKVRQEQIAQEQIAFHKAEAEKAAAEELCKQTSKTTRIVCNGVTTEIESISITPSKYSIGGVSLGGTKTSVSDYQEMKVRIVITQFNPQPQIVPSLEIKDLRLIFRLNSQRTANCTPFQKLSDLIKSTPQNGSGSFVFTTQISLPRTCSIGTYTTELWFVLGDKDPWVDLSSLPGSSFEIIESPPTEGIRCYAEGAVRKVGTSTLICEYSYPLPPNAPGEPVNLRRSSEVMLWRSSSNFKQTTVVYKGQKIGSKCSKAEVGLTVSTPKDLLKCTKVSSSSNVWKSIQVSDSDNARAFVGKACSALKVASRTRYIYNFNSLGTMLTEFTTASRFDSQYESVRLSAQLLYDKVVSKKFVQASFLQSALNQLNAACGTSVSERDFLLS